MSRSFNYKDNSGIIISGKILDEDAEAIIDLIWDSKFRYEERKK